ncbi:MAG: BatA domain-containing protein [Bacteroidetes bacterium]|nr:BatA domain-containing protein [Bacteroidota bacterium]MBP9879771.1 BatA domain-containing protein [Chitinophagales bacterium]
MQFLYPAFLFGLLALAIPVIIHLFNFRRFKTVYFTNVRFLKNIQEETATKSRLKHILVLISRMLAITFLVLAFAQPFIPSEQSANKATKKAVSIYIDNSFSMEAVNNDEQLLNIAKRKAEEIVNGYTIDDQFQLLTNDMEAKHQRLVSKEEMLQMITQVQCTPEVRSLSEIVKRQRDILNRDKAQSQKNIYAISDFQKNAAGFENDTTLNINLVHLQGKDQRNLAIDSVWFAGPVQILNQPIQLCYTISNYGEDEITNAPVTLKLNEQIKSIADITIPPLSKITDTMTFTLNEAGWYNGELGVKDYPVTFDDVLYFTFQPVSQIPVITINGKTENTFIQSLIGKNSLFALTNNNVAQIDFSSLDKFDLIILNEVKSISGGLADALNQQLERGCNIIIFPPADMDVAAVNNFLQMNSAGTYGNYVKSKRNVTAINTKNPVFTDVFEKVPKNLSLPFATESFQINAFSQTIEEMVMEFGDHRPMVAGYPAKQGVIYLSAVPLVREITDLQVQASLFAPMMYKIAVSTQKKMSLYVTIGETKWIDLPGINLTGDATLKVKSNNNEFIPEIRKAGNLTAVNLSDYTNVSGIYTLLQPGAPEGNTNQTLALNYNRSESDLSFETAASLKERYNAANINVIDDINRDFAGVVTQMNEGTPLWKFCIIFVLIFLAAEILLIRFLP